MVGTSAELTGGGECTRNRHIPCTRRAQEIATRATHKRVGFT